MLDESMDGDAEETDTVAFVVEDDPSTSLMVRLPEFAPPTEEIDPRYPTFAYVPDPLIVPDEVHRSALIWFKTGGAYGCTVYFPLYVDDLPRVSYTVMVYDFVPASGTLNV